MLQTIPSFYHSTEATPPGQASLKAFLQDVLLVTFSGCDWVLMRVSAISDFQSNLVFNPGVQCSKPQGGSAFNSDFNLTTLLVL